jgi:hypothetical protein
MRRRRWRGHLRAADQAELWRRWRQGEPLNAIARALDRRRSVVQRVLAGTGGFTPIPRRRSPRVGQRPSVPLASSLGHLGSWGATSSGCPRSRVCGPQELTVGSGSS